MSVIVRVEVDGKLVSYYEYDRPTNNAEHTVNKIHRIVSQYSPKWKRDNLAKNYVVQGEKARKPLDADFEKLEAMWAAEVRAKEKAKRDAMTREEREAYKLNTLAERYGVRKRPKRILTPEEFKEAYENKELIENYEVRPAKVKRKHDIKDPNVTPVTSDDWHDKLCDCKDPDCPDRP